MYLIITLTTGLLQLFVTAVAIANSSHIRSVRSLSTFRFRDFAVVSSSLDLLKPNPSSNPLCDPPTFIVRTRPRINQNTILRPLAYKSSAYFSILGELDLSRCFIRFSETRLVDVTPMFTAETGSIEECLSMCLASEANEYPGDCESAVYHPVFHECQLFNVSGRSDEATVTMQYGYDYYEPTDCPGCIINDPVGVTYQPQMKRRKTTVGPTTTKPLGSPKLENKPKKPIPDKKPSPKSGISALEAKPNVKPSGK